MNQIKKKIALLLCLVLIFSAFSSVANADELYDYSNKWFTSENAAGNIKWHINDDNAQLMKKVWVNDLESTMEEKPWYLIDENGSMIDHPIVKDKDGYYYAINNSVHDGSYGHMLYKDGEYYGVQLSFNRNHDGHYGAITNADGIAALAAKYGVKELTGDYGIKYLGKKAQRTSTSRQTDSSKNPFLKTEADIWNYIFNVGFNKEIEEEEEGPRYLTFTAEQDNSSVTVNYYSGTNIQYSTDSCATWIDCPSGTTITLDEVGDAACLKGEGIITTQYINDDIIIPHYFSMSGKIAASGSVTSLTDGVGNNQDVILDKYCYAAMFYCCSGLTTAPELPATTLAEGCYDYMFYGAGLTTVPELPAKTLVKDCYANMFMSCTSLTTAPELPATILAEECYFNMFLGCTALETAPALPATTLAKCCYDSMFCSCTALKTAPSLPATTLADKCYASMFAGCTSLKIEETDSPNPTNKIFTCPNTDDSTNPVADMFDGTDGTFTSTPTAGKTYYYYQ